MSENGVKKMKRMYLAAPLFSESELQYNLYLKSILSQYFEVFLPQQDGELILNLIKEGISIHSAANKIFNADVKAIQQCDVILIILDGRAIDEGAAFELGLAYALGKKCIGLQTDIRRLLPIGNNPMIDCALEFTFNSINDLLTWAKSECSNQFTDNISDQKAISNN